MWILFGTFCALWTWTSVFFPRVGKFSSIVASGNSLPLSLSSPSWTPIMWMLDAWCDRGLLNCPHFFKLFFKIVFFLFFLQLGWSLVLCLSVHWSVPLYYLICYWYRLVIKIHFISIIIFFNSIWFFMFSISWLNSSLCLSIGINGNSPKFTEHLYDH